MNNESELAPKQLKRAIMAFLLNSEFTFFHLFYRMFRDRLFYMAEALRGRTYEEKLKEIANEHAGGVFCEPGALEKMSDLRSKVFAVDVDQCLGQALPKLNCSNEEEIFIVAREKVLDLAEREDFTRDIGKHQYSVVNDLASSFPKIDRVLIKELVEGLLQLNNEALKSLDFSKPISWGKWQQFIIKPSEWKEVFEIPDVVIVITQGRAPWNEYMDMVRMISSPAKPKKIIVFKKIHYTRKRSVLNKVKKLYGFTKDVILLDNMRIPPSSDDGVVGSNHQIPTTRDAYYDSEGGYNEHMNNDGANLNDKFKSLMRDIEMQTQVYSTSRSSLWKAEPAHSKLYCNIL